MEDCQPQCMAIKLIVLGVILILVRLYTSWDMWLVVGAILIIKAIMLFIMPVCPCNKKKK